MNKGILIVAVSLWAILGMFSAFVMARFAVTPGRAATNPPIEFPAEPSQLQDSAKYRLLVFAHPLCPCTRATLSEIAEIKSQSGDKIDALAYFYVPADDNDEFRSSGTVEAARAIEQLNITFDEDGATARRFGANTSGQVLLYSPAGELVYAGGITPGRGHVGPNDGRAAILNIVAGDRKNGNPSPVFGCAINDSVQTFD